MIERITALLLRVGLLLSALVAITYLVRMLVAAFVPVEWYWGGALASLSAPVALAAALHLSAGYSVTLKERV